ncbi:hypothetical protein B6V73_16475 [Thioclava sp. JM3]|uniref:ABC transporter ATP-binding protein n=1 Tax=Thioclava sp. JM3 TaxID=1973004 RepID=UPI000B53A012|nr:ABC transporter ATP-binding protein [Thioclava sp. JM3]OWY14193.1 hypothetical protein B6V73_16475 [Thioclava sp. JM3]
MIAPWRQALRRVPRWRLWVFAALLAASSLTDGVGLILLVPLLSAMSGAEFHNAVASRLVDGIAATGLPLTPAVVLGLFVGAVALRSAIQYGRDLQGLRLQHDVVDRFRGDCIRHLNRADWRWLTRQKHSDYMSLVMTDVNRIGNGLHSGMTLVTSLSAAVAYLVAAAVVSPSMAALTAVAGGVGFAAMRGIRARAHQLGGQQLEANRAMTADVQHSVSGLKTLKALSTDDRHIERLIASISRVRAGQLKLGRITSLTTASQQIIGAVLISGYVLIGWSYLQVPLAALVALTFFFSRLMPLFASAQQMLHRVINAEPPLAAVLDFLEQSAAHAEAAPAQMAARWNVAQSIGLQDVGLRYEERSPPALAGIDLTLPAGSTTAIIGPSGAGKSTLADVLMGLIEPDAGHLLIDGVRVRGEMRVRWRQSVAYVPQEVFLFDDTIRANLLWGNPAATTEALLEALDKAAAGFVRNLPNGLDTVVGANGMRLSGGERQRLTIARALLARPSLLIMDEATSALDPANELAIRDALRRLHGDLIIVLIGHRLATLEHADQVIELNAGRIARMGSWSELRGAELTS